MAKEGLLVSAYYSKSQARMGWREIKRKRDRERGDWLIWKVCSCKMFKDTIKSQPIQKYS